MAASDSPTFHPFSYAKAISPLLQFVIPTTAPMVSPPSSSSSTFSYRVCGCFRRRFRMGADVPPDEVREVFEEYAENGVMHVEEVQLFLEAVQRQVGATKDDAQAVLDSLGELKHLGVVLRKGLNLDAFYRYLFSDHNMVVSPFDKVNQDMGAPLSHYYIYTGHNSYLTGNQLSSDCSEVPIKEALLRGVRVIELDLWPNPTSDDIHIIHGGTLTRPVKLITCLQTIKEHAFVTSPYPVVITLEDQLSVSPGLRTKVANMITETFGSMLFYPDDQFAEFPPLDSLKNRIMISTKPPEKENVVDTHNTVAETKNVVDTHNTVAETKNVKKKKKKKKEDQVKEEPWGQEIPSFLQDAEVDDKSDHDQGDEDSDDDIQMRTAPEYQRLIAIHAGKGKGSTKDSLMNDPEKVRRLSMSEQKLEKAIVKHAGDIIRFTQRNLLRVYPKGTRIGSSNYNPLIGWMHGAQMVAFNMQGHGRPLWLMQGMFRANGGCGYIKKPDFLLKNRSNGEVYDPKKETKISKILKVKVYMGDGWRFDFRRTYFDYYSPPDFYTKVGIIGVPADHCPMKRTETVEDKWIPMWNQKYSFELRVPELAFLRIEVHEEDLGGKDDFGGQTCLPVSEIRPGIRAVPLYNRKGVRYNNVKLLMRFDMEDRGF